MGARGPVPKRSDARRRANKPATESGEISTAPAAEVVPIPESSEDWHPVAIRWFESLKVSGQRKFYEPSDWAMAYLIAESISRDLNPQFVGVTAGDHSEPVYEVIPLKGASLSAYLKAMGNLLATEGDRRRASIELHRGEVVDPDEDASVTALADYRANLGA
jgi:hypothetical protein